MSSGTSNVLLVPMHIDALHVPAGAPNVRQAFADYSLLPYEYHDEDGWNVPANTPNLSATILSEPCSGGSFNLSLGTGIHLLDACRKLSGDAFEWRSDVVGGDAIDLLAGTDTLRLGLDAGESPTAIIERWEEEAAVFAERAREFWRYAV